MGQLWEILVPRVFNEGIEIPLDYHRVWDERVRKISSGLTILKSAKGVWQSPSGEIFQEEMIPVRIACTKAQIDEIVDLTLDYYEQEAVMAYLVSDYVIIKHQNK